MDLKFCDIDDLKTLRPDLFKAIEQEVLLGKMKLTKDDILTMIEPLSRCIKEFLKPYLAKLSAMTYNDIVDMENDIMDEVAEQLLNEFEELEEIVRKRTNSNNREALFAKEPESDIESIEPEQTDIVEPCQEDAEPADNKESDDDLEEVKIGYVLRLFPSQKVGSVIEIKTTKSGLRKLVLKMTDGTLREEYDNDNLYEVIRKNGIIKEEDYVVEKEKRHYRRKFSWNSALEVTKETSKQDFSTEKKEALVGDEIQYDGKRCKVIGKKTSANSMRLIIQYDDGTLDNVPNDWNRYSLMDKGKNGDYCPSSKAIRKFDITNKRKKRATVGDWVMRTSDNLIGKVVEIKKLGSGIEKLILELEDGSQSGVFNSTNLYWVLL